MDRLTILTAAALTGLASRDHERHGHTPPSIEELGARAVAMGRATLDLLEEIETAPTKPARPIKAR